MKEIRIKGESQSTRCEICHQADMFDATTNECSRCKGMEKLKTKQTIDIDYILKDYANDPFHKLIGFSFSITGILLVVKSFGETKEGFNLLILCILGIISILAGLTIPKYYSRKINRLKRILKNVQMEDVEITFRVKESASGGAIFYAEINKEGSFREIKLAFPHSDAIELIDKPVSGKLCFDTLTKSPIVLVDKFVVFGEHW